MSKKRKQSATFTPDSSSEKRRKDQLGGPFRVVQVGEGGSRLILETVYRSEATYRARNMSGGLAVDDRGEVVR